MGDTSGQADDQTFGEIFPGKIIETFIVTITATALTFRRRWPVAAWAIVALTTACQGKHLSSRQAVVELPVPCAQSRGAYCLLPGVDSRDVSTTSAETRLEIANPYEQGAPLYIIESAQCLRARSSRILAKKRSAKTVFQGKSFEVVDVSLNRSGCHLEIWFHAESSSAAPVFLTYFRPCFDERCLGNPFYEFLPQLRRR
jgi:hypothetical protein